jgi:hypothetical protein
MIKAVAIKTDDFFIKYLKEINLDQKRIDLLDSIASCISNELSKGKTIYSNYNVFQHGRELPFYSRYYQTFSCRF